MFSFRAYFAAIGLHSSHLIASDLTCMISRSILQGIRRVSTLGDTLGTPELAGSPGNHIRPTDFFFNGLWQRNISSRCVVFPTSFAAPPPGNAESSSLLYRAYILVLAASASP